LGGGGGEKGGKIALEARKLDCEKCPFESVQEKEKKCQILGGGKEEIRLNTAEWVVRNVVWGKKKKGGFRRFCKRGGIVVGFTEGKGEKGGM